MTTAKNYDMATHWQSGRITSRTNSSICFTSCQTCAQYVDNPWEQKWQGKKVVQKLVACGFNVPPDELQNGEWFWLSRWTVLKAEEQEGQAGGGKVGKQALYLPFCRGCSAKTTIMAVWLLLIYKQTRNTDFHWMLTQLLLLTCTLFHCVICVTGDFLDSTSR